MNFYRSEALNRHPITPGRDPRNLRYSRVAFGGTVNP